jgi:hypothetical protein
MAKKIIENKSKKIKTPDQLKFVRVEITKFKSGTSYKLIYE